MRRTCCSPKAGRSRCDSRLARAASTRSTSERSPISTSRRETRLDLPAMSRDSLRLTGSVQAPVLTGPLNVDRGSIFLADRDIARKQAVDVFEDTPVDDGGGQEQDLLDADDESAAERDDHARRRASAIGGSERQADGRAPSDDVDGAVDADRRRRRTAAPAVFARGRPEYRPAAPTT